MPHPLHSSLHNTDPTEMCRLDFPVGTVIEDTGKEVEEIFGESHDGTLEPKRNKVYHDPDGVGLLVEIGNEDGNMQRFLSYFFKGILPMTEIIAHNDNGGGIKYYSLAFDPDKISTQYTEAECLAGGHLLEAFGDEDHYYIPEDGDHWNIVKSGDKHYFYDFQVNPYPLKEFPQEMIPYGGYSFMRKDVREAFFRMIGALRARYGGENGKMHFFAIGKKVGFMQEEVEAIWEKFMTQLEKLSTLDESRLESWVQSNEKYMVD